MIFGLVELLQADADVNWLDWAVALQRRQDERFWDEAEGGWFSTTGRDASVLLRMKEDYDGAEPTASSVSVLNLLALSHLIDDAVWTNRIDRTLKYFGERLQRMGRAVPMMAAALSTAVAGVQQIVIAAGENRDRSEVSDLERAVAGKYLPFAVTLTIGAEGRRLIAERLPFVEAMQPIGGVPAAYVCRHFTCRQPVTTPAALTEELAAL